MGGRVRLALVDPGNRFQQLLKADAEAAARAAGVALETVFTGENFQDELTALRAIVSAPAPDAVAVMAVRDQGLAHAVHDAAAAGVHWVFLNAVEDDLDPIRRQFPSVAITTVCPDEVETGRIQGRQMRALVAPGRRVLYVQGNPRSLTSRLRAEGMRQETSGAGIDVALAGGDWNPDEARRSVQGWLRFGIGGRRPFDLVTCQNDELAAAALEAIAGAAAAPGRGDLARIRVTGCDGSPDVGQKMVREGRLAATVILPRVAAPAIELLARVLACGERPGAVVLHTPMSYPSLDELLPTA